MSIKILKVSTPKEIKYVAKLAKEIWEEHFTPIIGKDQVAYMLKNFQSDNAIKSQIDNGATYYLVKLENDWAGYAGVITDLSSKKMMLSKIYIKNSMRNKGIGTSLLEHIEKSCMIEDLSSLWLTVNRYNTHTISWYKYHGFETIDEVKKDIGEGFFMDDYIMEKRIS